MNSSNRRKTDSSNPALCALEDFLAEPNRQAVLRRELLATGISANACDRALRRKCQVGTLTRVGRGIYAIGTAGVIEVVPEVLPKLGYRILGKPKVKGYSEFHAGTVWHTDRRCNLLIRRGGAVASFKATDGKWGDPLRRLRRKGNKDVFEPPTYQDVEDTFQSFPYCHSLARTEKHLIVQQALQVWERFSDPRCELALTGETALTNYHAVTHRFSEDLDLTVVLNEETSKLASDAKAKAVLDIGGKFLESIHTTMPYLAYDKRSGRRQRQGRTQTFMFDFDPMFPDVDVRPRVKFEIALGGNETHSLVSATGVSEKPVLLLEIHDICAGKFQALSRHMPGNAVEVYPDLVRHVFDCGALATTLNRNSLVAVLKNADYDADGISTILADLKNPAWKRNYEDYLLRMGNLPTQHARVQYPTWSRLRSQFEKLAEDLLVGLGRDNQSSPDTDF